MLNWVRVERADSDKYTTEEIYLNNNKNHRISVTEMIYGSYIYYYVNDYPQIKRYLEGKYLDEAKEFIVDLVKQKAYRNISFYENVLSCLEGKD
jgi:hypothetical protein